MDFERVFKRGLKGRTPFEKLFCLIKNWVDGVIGG